MGSHEPGGSLATHLFQNKMNLFYTLLIYFNNFAYGMTANIVGPVMVDLAAIYSTSMDTISYVQVAFGLGYLIGSTANVLYRRLNRQLCLAIFVLIVSGCNTFLPSYGSLWLLFPAYVVLNIGCGAWDAATSIWLVDMWPVGNSAILQGGRFTYGIGATVAPLLASPFVFGKANVTASNETITVGDRAKSLTYPFAINSALQAIVPIIFLINFICCRYDNHDSSAQSNDEDDDHDDDCSIDSNDSNTKISHRTMKVALAGLMSGLYISAEMAYLAFGSSMYQNLDIKLAASTASQVQSLLFITYTAGRLITAFISLKLTPDIILAYHYVTIIVSIILLFFGRNSVTLIFVANATFGFGCSAMWPLMFSFTEHYLGLTSRICSLFSFLCGFMGMIVPIILAQVFSRFPLILLYLVGAFNIASFVTFLSVRLWIGLSAEPARKRLSSEEQYRHRYSIAGPRLSVHWANYREDRLRRQSISPSKYSVEANERRRKSTVSGASKKYEVNGKQRQSESDHQPDRRMSTAPGY